MIYIISGTNRKNSKTFEVSQIVQRELKSLGRDVQIVDLCEIPMDALHAADYGKSVPPQISEIINSLNQSEGLYFVIPEYNGSFPGVLKYFIDYFSYPETFEFRPVAFTGLGWRFGGLRPVEHLQQVFNYRNAFIYPERLFIQNAPNVVQNTTIGDEKLMEVLKRQVLGFSKFIDALKSQGLDANSVNQRKNK